MKQDRKIRQHITAAKGWLSRAEDSLAQKNDIQGDLKLMLAQAELKRAQEKNDKKLCVRWFKKLVPGVLASVLALGGIIYVSQSEDSVALPIASQTNRDSMAKDGLPQRTAPEEVVVNNEMAPISKELPRSEETVKAEVHSNSEQLTQEGTSDYMPIAKPAAVKSQQAVNNLATSQQSKIPGPDMQKLMQSAGSMLRE